ncbi:MAG: undecaprenyldiphospho-muramoylpentapeptide beta-N-acetylglucosaminyltransferase [Bacilli bacterium]|nr:undecaprenyldiphospho-muramoylpentapeptide beta-N-acetylglucosaminyltransferase [Bacilli bacterium]
MRVIISAGGTGGHIYPALAIARKIKEKEYDSEILYIGTHNRMEKDIVPMNNINYVPIEIYGFTKNNIKNDLKDLYLIPQAISKCKKIMKEFKPDIVIGVGGYVTYPVIKAAQKLGIKTFIHEQNSIPGKSNKWVAKKADLIGVSFKESLKYFGKNAILTGNPTATKAISNEKIDKTKFGLHRNKKCVLIVNGSLGSSVMNNKMEDFLSNVADEDYEILYITGKSYYDKFKEKEFPSNVFIEPFIDNLSGLMKDIDLIVSRAGASSLAEITALGLPSILVPSPYVANNHQYYNALTIKDNNAGELIEEKDLNKDILKEKINKILSDPDKYKKYKENALKLSMPESGDVIYEAIKKVIG